MNIVQSWKEAVYFLRPATLRPFILVTGKTIFDIYKAINEPLTSRGNLIAAVIVILCIGLSNIIKMFHLFLLSTLLLNGIHYFLVFIFVLAMRPSVGIKDKAYFIFYIKKYWYLLVTTLVFGMIYLPIIPFVFILYVLFLLHAIDSEGSSRALWDAFKNSFKMFIYNFPLFFLLFLLFLVIDTILYFLIAFALGYFGGLTIAALLYILFVPIEVACITNLYIKFLHGQPSLYFDQPE